MNTTSHCRGCGSYRQHREHKPYWCLHWGKQASKAVEHCKLTGERGKIEQNYEALGEGKGWKRCQ